MPRMACHGASFLLMTNRDFVRGSPSGPNAKARFPRLCLEDRRARWARQSATARCPVHWKQARCCLSKHRAASVCEGSLEVKHAHDRNVAQAWAEAVARTRSRQRGVWEWWKRRSADCGRPKPAASRPIGGSEPTRIRRFAQDNSGICTSRTGGRPGTLGRVGASCLRPWLIASGPSGLRP